MLLKLIGSLGDSLRHRVSQRLAMGGLALQNRNRISNAIRRFRLAVNVDPNNVDALCLLGNAYQTNGQNEFAVNVLRRAIAVAPEESHPRLLLANILALPMHRDEVIRLLSDALLYSVDSDSLRLHFRIALLMDPTRNSASESGGVPAPRPTQAADAAIAHYREALMVHGDSPEMSIHQRLGLLLYMQGQSEQARHHYEQAGRFDTTGVAAIKRVPVLPPIPLSREHILDIRDRLDRDIECVMAGPVQTGCPEDDISHTDFYLAYQGLDDRTLRERLARMYLHAYPSLGYVAPESLPPRSDTSNKLRIGIISRALRDHTIGRLMIGLYRNLDRTKFEVTTFSFSEPMDELAKEIGQLSTRSVVLKPSLDAARRQIAAEHLDILLYSDIGMDATTYFLAFSRLAPVQCVTWGHPLTTGLPSIDWFISSALVEPPNGSDHYSERLACLPDSCAYVNYARPSTPPVATRAELGLPTDTNLYVCLQTLFKLHPDFDDIIGALLRMDPSGHLVLLDSPPELRVQLEARWKPSLGDVLTRVMFVPSCDRTRYLQLLLAADVVLDTPHFGGGNSSLEALAMGAPVVTLPGSLARGRFTLADYRRMDVLDCVADSVDEYVAIAARLATDRAYNAEIREKIRKSVRVLFDDLGTIRALEEFFVRVAGQPAT